MAICGKRYEHFNEIQILTLKKYLQTKMKKQEKKRIKRSYRASGKYGSELDSDQDNVYRY